MANGSDAVPWTIKAMPVAAREKATRYARMDGATMAEWMVKAIDTQAAKHDGIQVIPPGKPDGAAGKPQTAAATPSVSLGDAALALQAMAAAAAAGLPVSKAATRDTVTVIRAWMRVGRGLPAGQTQRRIGQTISQDHAEAD